MPDRRRVARVVAAPSGESAGPQLTRTLGGFQVFAVSFAFISVAVGVFATYGEMLQTAGPVGIWLWIIAAVGQTLVEVPIAVSALLWLVLVLIVLATPDDARIPLTIVLGLVVVGAIYFLWLLRFRPDALRGSDDAAPADGVPRRR